MGLDGVRADIAVVQTPDGHGRLELTKFRTPSSQDGTGPALANAPGLRHVAFAVDDIDAAVPACGPAARDSWARWVRYEDSYLLCYVQRTGGDHRRTDAEDRLTARR